MNKAFLPFLYSAVLSIALGMVPGLAAEGVSQAGRLSLQYEPSFILEAVARRMNVALNPDIAVPTIFLASATSMRRFQDAIEEQWGSRPGAISNVYVIDRNEIFLLDDASRYVGLERTLDESLAHEFAHYLQVRYFKEDFTSDGAELQAVAIQTWFRVVHVQNAQAN